MTDNNNGVGEATGPKEDGIVGGMVEAARTLINGRADCGWLTVITRATLTDKGARFDDDPTPDTDDTTPTKADTNQQNASHRTNLTDGTEPEAAAAPPSADTTILGDEKPARSTPDPQPVASQSDKRPALPAHAPTDTVADGDGAASLSEPESRTLDRRTASQVEGQFGMRLRVQETYYPNLVAFVERFFARVFPYHQSAVVPIKWTSQWWRWPALVFPLDALWRSYEAARKTPAGMVNFYAQAANMIDRVFNKDTGVIASLPVKEEHTRAGEPLPCEHPPRDWRAGIVAQLEPPRPEGRAHADDHTAGGGERNWK